MFAPALAHAVFAARDSGEPRARGFCWGSGASVLLLTIYRVLVARAAAASVRGFSPDAAAARPPYGLVAARRTGGPDAREATR